ncbi:hypothetical protein [Massilia sp. YMA4]|uniref:hypothetical protein n=1 Tax=Massilia sp. YMA4 TaxID=1593482 RepID=UPI000DD17EEA|nr:hypothetical protein [Massilia sp. YMA4]AXA94152.1 hypothetical protein DPH57_25285 [Massilia sp. YMA4]
MTHHIEFLPPLALADAIATLACQTGKEVSRDAFFRIVVEHALPLYAATPPDARVVYYSAAGDDHSAADDYDGYPRPLAVLMTPDTRDLWVHGSAITKRVVIYPGQPGFMPWGSIKERRAELRELGMSKVGANSNEDVTGNGDERQLVPMWTPDDDELMGQSSVVFFTNAVLVNDQNCRVPVHTLKELLHLYKSATFQPSVPAAPRQAQVNKLNYNLLDRPIEQALLRADAGRPAEVFTALRDMALEGIAPFTGQVDAKGLWYTDHENELKPFTKGALRKRLDRMK